MGCCFSSNADASATTSQQQQLQQQNAGHQSASEQQALAPSKREAPTKQYTKPKWKAPQPMSEARLQALRDEFWDTQPHYGGDKVIWDAIKAACDAPDMGTSRLLIEAAGVIVARPDMTVMYDERGARYVLPNYVLAAPSNLAPGAAAQQQQQQQQQQHLERLSGEVQLQPRPPLH